MSITFGGGKRDRATLTWTQEELSDEEGVAKDSEICAICTEPLDGETTPTVMCGHVFHTACRTQFLRSNQPAKWLCPVCREQMFVGNAERARLREPVAAAAGGSAAAAEEEYEEEDEEEENPLLSYTSQFGLADEVERLLAAGANVNANADYALRIASRNGHLRVVRLLLAAGADVHANGDHALREASENGHAEVAQLLLAAGADRRVLIAAGARRRV